MGTVPNFPGKWGLSPILFFLLVSASGCVSIPKAPYVVSGGGGSEVVRNEVGCGENRIDTAARPGGLHSEGIDPGGFTLLNWNIQKGGREGWAEDFTRLTGDADLLALQEAYLTDPLRTLLRDRDYRWDMAAAFLNRKREAGVLTGSKSAPVAFCVTRFAEPLVVIPKTALTSLYPLAETDLYLLVVNVHLINFTVDTSGYRGLLQALEESLASHEGPLLLTGDFNTWSNERLRAVEALRDRLGLTAVIFAEGGPSRFLGKNVDHVLYRGLEPVEARAVQISSSDHNPLLVTFRVPRRGGVH